LHGNTKNYGEAFLTLPTYLQRCFQSSSQFCNTTQFFTKMVQLYILVCTGVRRNFSMGGHYWIFPNVFLGGPKVMKFVFYHPKPRKQLFAEIFKFLPLFRHPCLCVENVRATPLNNWCNYKRFNTILNSEILLNLIRKIKYLADQFQLCFCFCVGNAKQLYFISALATQLASLGTTC